MTTFRLVNAHRSGREYRADLEVGDRVIGYVERAQSGKMLGYRAGSYRAKIEGFVVATGDTLTELRAELRDHFEAEASWDLR